MAQSLVWGACIIAGLFAFTKPSRAANCALYARAETGVALYGAAGGWWDEASGRYERSHVPAAGAILVFQRTRRIPSGHVAVVSRIISAREILVDHANWYRGTISRGMSVIDTSPGHDWTSVAVMDLASGTHGSDYPTYGFVYPGSAPREIIETRAGGGLDSGIADVNSRSTLLHFAVAAENWPERAPRTPQTHRTHQAKEAVVRPVRTVSAAHGHTHSAASAKSRSPAHAPHAGTAHTPTHPVRTAEAKHHRA
jgi:hypothetical protein